MTKKIGIIIIVLTFLVSLNPYLLIFTVPVFLLGSILVWVSKGKILTKALWTILPIILWYPSFLVFMYLSGTIGTATAQKLDFIFSENFIGRVEIVSNIPCGQEKIIKEGREQLFIPDNGIFLYKEEIRTGYVNHKYYRQDKNGILKEMPSLANYMFWDSEKNQPAKDTIGVYLRETGSKTSLVPEPKIEYSSMVLVVSSQDSTDKYYDFHYLSRFETEVDSLVRECEKKKTAHNNTYTKSGW
jgi:hypothetical protein